MIRIAIASVFAAGVFSAPVQVGKQHVYNYRKPLVFVDETIPVIQKQIPKADLLPEIKLETGHLESLVTGAEGKVWDFAGEITGKWPVPIEVPFKFGGARRLQQLGSNLPKLGSALPQLGQLGVLSKVTESVSELDGSRVSAVVSVVQETAGVGVLPALYSGRALGELPHKKIYGKTHVPRYTPTEYRVVEQPKHFDVDAWKTDVFNFADEGAAALIHDVPELSTAELKEHAGAAIEVGSGTHPVDYIPSIDIPHWKGYVREVVDQDIPETIITELPEFDSGDLNAKLQPLTDQDLGKLYAYLPEVDIEAIKIGIADLPVYDVTGAVDYVPSVHTRDITSKLGDLKVNQVREKLVAYVPEVALDDFRHKIEGMAKDEIANLVDHVPSVDIDQVKEKIVRVSEENITHVGQYIPNVDSAKIKTKLQAIDGGGIVGQVIEYTPAVGTEEFKDELKVLSKNDIREKFVGAIPAVDLTGWKKVRLARDIVPKLPNIHTGELKGAAYEIARQDYSGVVDKVPDLELGEWKRTVKNVVDVDVAKKVVEYVPTVGTGEIKGKVEGLVNSGTGSKIAGAIPVMKLPAAVGKGKVILPAGKKWVKAGGVHGRKLRGVFDILDQVNLLGKVELPEVRLGSSAELGTRGLETTSYQQRDSLFAPSVFPLFEEGILSTDGILQTGLTGEIVNFARRPLFNPPVVNRPLDIINIRP